LVLIVPSGPIVAGISLAPELDRTGNLCVFAMVTGRPCPACGGTRVVLDLAQLDVLSALEHNLLITAAIGVLAVIAVVRWRSVFDVLRSPRRLERVLEAASVPLTRWPMTVPVAFVLAWAWNFARW